MWWVCHTGNVQIKAFALKPYSLNNFMALLCADMVHYSLGISWMSYGTGQRHRGCSGDTRGTCCFLLWQKLLQVTARFIWMLQVFLCNEEVGYCSSWRRLPVYFLTQTSLQAWFLHVSTISLCVNDVLKHHRFNLQQKPSRDITSAGVH